MHYVSQVLKRLLEIFLALAALLVLSPVFILVMLVLRLTGERQVFFLQERVGYKNKKFYIIKFTTMVANSENLGTGSITLRQDPRVTKVGRVLRATKINELPQLINLLKGDMSIVGPRPLMVVDFDKYHVGIRRVVYNIKPGLTGIGSIFFRDEEKLVSESSLAPKEFYKEYISTYKGRLELWYQEHRSITIDLLIIFLTVWIVFVPNSQLPNRLFKNLPKN